MVLRCVFFRHLRNDQLCQRTAYSHLLGPTSCGKTQRVLDLIEEAYRHHFDNIIILCPTLRWNKTYLDRAWIWKDDYVFPV